MFGCKEEDPLTTEAAVNLGSDLIRQLSTAQIRTEQRGRECLLTAYAGQGPMIAMDQRNASQSAGPLETGDPWGSSCCRLPTTPSCGVESASLRGRIFHDVSTAREW